MTRSTSTFAAWTALGLASLSGALSVGPAAHADHAEGGRLVTLRGDAASPTAMDLGGPLRDGRIARTLAGDRHVVVERIPTPRRNPTPPVEWGSYIAVGTSEGLLVRVREGTVRTLALGPIDVRPVVMPSGELLVATRDFRLVLVDRDLEIRAEARLSGAPRPSPLILPDGSVVFTTSDRTLTRVDSDLARIFVTSTAVGSIGVTHAPAFLPPDRIIVGAIDRLCVFDLSGQLLWTADVGDRISAPPVVTPDGTVHLVLAGGHIAQVEHGRHVRQRLPIGGRVIDQSSMLARDDDGSYRVAIPTLGVVAIDPDGSTRWTVSTDAPFHGPVAIDASHQTLAFDRRGRLGVISPSGELLERVELGGISHGFPMIASDGTLWATTDVSELVHVGVAPRPDPPRGPGLP